MFAGSGTTDERKLELPVVMAASVDPHWLDERKSAVPREALEAWRKAGHVVTQSEEIWRIDFEDGRQVLLPVEQVEIDYAAEKSVL